MVNQSTQDFSRNSAGTESLCVRTSRMAIWAGRNARSQGLGLAWKGLSQPFNSLGLGSGG